MQTFLPHSDFRASAQTLDRQRLGKQRVEVLQLLKALTGEGKGWARHPAALMWQGHNNALVAYGVEVCLEWRGRGYKDSCLEKIASYFSVGQPSPMPSWVGEPEFHLSHQSNLVRKLPEHYSPLFPGVPSDLPYVWPTP